MTINSRDKYNAIINNDHVIAEENLNETQNSENFNQLKKRVNSDESLYSQIYKQSSIEKVNIRNIVYAIRNLMDILMKRKDNVKIDSEIKEIYKIKDKQESIEALMELEKKVVSIFQKSGDNSDLTLKHFQDTYGAMFKEILMGKDRDDESIALTATQINSTGKNLWSDSNINILQKFSTFFSSIDIYFNKNSLHKSFKEIYNDLYYDLVHKSQSRMLFKKILMDDNINFAIKQEIAKFISNANKKQLLDKKRTNLLNQLASLLNNLQQTYVSEDLHKTADALSILVMNSTNSTVIQKQTLKKLASIKETISKISEEDLIVNKLYEALHVVMTHNKFGLEKGIIIFLDKLIKNNLGLTSLSSGSALNIAQDAIWKATDETVKELDYLTKLAGEGKKDIKVKSNSKEKNNNTLKLSSKEASNLKRFKQFCSNSKNNKIKLDNHIKQYNLNDPSHNLTEADKRQVNLNNISDHEYKYIKYVNKSFLNNEEMNNRILTKNEIDRFKKVQSINHFYLNVVKESKACKADLDDYIETMLFVKNGNESIRKQYGNIKTIAEKAKYHKMSFYEFVSTIIKLDKFGINVYVCKNIIDANKIQMSLSEFTRILDVVSHKLKTPYTLSEGLIKYATKVAKDPSYKPYYTLQENRVRLL